MLHKTNPMSRPVSRVVGGSIIWLKMFVELQQVQPILLYFRIFLNYIENTTTACSKYKHVANCK